MMRRNKQISAKLIGYINGDDSTLSGSRNGLSPMILWEYFATHGKKVQIENAVEC